MSQEPIELYAPNRELGGGGGGGGDCSIDPIRLLFKSKKFTPAL